MNARSDGGVCLPLADRAFHMFHARPGEPEDPMQALHIGAPRDSGAGA